MKKMILSGLITCICLLAVFLPQSGEAGPARMKSVKEQLNTAIPQLIAAEEVLRSKDQADWTQQEIEDYLLLALYVVNNNVIVYIETHRQTPQSSRVLMDQGLIEKWPGNPFNGWEPISWDGDEFTPGDLVFQECPPELYSGLHNPKPMTFKLSINGPTADYVPLQPVTYGLDNWASLPAGTAFMLGAGTWSQSEAMRQYNESKAAEQSESTQAESD